VTGLLPAVLACALAYAGMAALCFAMGRHFEQATGRRSVPPRLRRALRVAGAVLLGASLQVSLDGWGAGVGWVAWLGFLTVGALLTTGLWAAWPRLAAGAAAVCAASGLLALIPWLR
jgi:hypothetical protein